MRRYTLLPKRIFKQIGFSVATIALGFVLWSNVPARTTTAEDGLCIPGAKDWPECRFKETKTVAISELR